MNRRGSVFAFATMLLMLLALAGCGGGKSATAAGGVATGVGGAISTAGAAASQTTGAVGSAVSSTSPAGSSAASAVSSTRPAGSSAASAVSSTSATGSSAASASGSGTTINVVAKDFAFALDKSSVPAGNVSFVMRNDGPSPHNIQINNKTSDTVNAGVTTTLTVNLPAGTYTYVCTVPGHEQLGMKGTLKVT